MANPNWRKWTTCHGCSTIIEPSNGSLCDHCQVCQAINMRAMHEQCAAQQSQIESLQGEVNGLRTMVARMQEQIDLLLATPPLPPPEPFPPWTSGGTRSASPSSSQSGSPQLPPPEPLPPPTSGGTRSASPSSSQSGSPQQLALVPALPVGLPPPEVSSLISALLSASNFNTNVGSSCPSCRATTAGDSIPSCPLPEWVFDVDYAQCDWGRRIDDSPLVQLFDYGESVAMASSTSWIWETAIRQNLFSEGVDQSFTDSCMNRIIGGIKTGNLDGVWHRTKSGAHMVLALRCTKCNFIISVQTCSAQKYDEARRNMIPLQLALGHWLGVPMPSPDRIASAPAR